jgi:hypothetical protein
MQIVQRPWESYGKTYVMSDRDVQLEEMLRHEPEMILRSGRNWTAVGFFAGLSLMHYSISIPSFLRGHWEGYLSFAFATIFAVVTVIAWVSRYEMAIFPGSKNVRLRTGFRFIRFERFVPFASIHGVRLTVMGASAPSEWKIELLCRDEDIECPPTSVPRQEALYLAMAMNVELIKVSPADVPGTPERIDSL